MSYEPDYDDEDVAEVDAKELPKGAITVTIDVDQWLNGSLQDVVVNALVRNLSDKLNGAVNKAVAAKVNELADAQFHALAAEKLEEFFIKAHRKTNSWGEPTGESYSIRELLMDRFKQYLDAKVDSDGRESSYGNGTTRAQFILNSLAHKPLQSAIDETVKGIAGQAKAQIQATVSRYIAEQLAPTISVPAIKG